MSASARSTRRTSSSGTRPRWLLSLTAAGIILVALSVVLALRGGDDTTRTAFAAAPSGDYAVVVFPGEEVDIISAIGAESGASYELARIAHLPGYTSFAAVSPDGLHLAVVAADSGTVAKPVAALLVVNVETGSITRIVEGIDQLQQPAWADDSQNVIVTRTTENEGALASVAFVRGGINGVTAVIGEFEASGAYPVGFDSAGRLIAVAIDESGSSLFADFAPLVVLAKGVTRDWKLSPDGTQIAFIEADTSAGLRYLPRVVSLDGDLKGAAAAQSLGTETEAIGTTWQPGGQPLFGTEPGAATDDGSVEGRSIQSQTLAGFDVPLGFNADGQWLATQHWTGESFDAPGVPGIQLISQEGMRELPGATRFYGWARR